jgi:hypothetical protein
MLYVTSEGSVHVMYQWREKQRSCQNLECIETGTPHLHLPPPSDERRHKRPRGIKFSVNTSISVTCPYFPIQAALIKGQCNQP